MHDGFEQYRAELNAVRLTENEKAALLQALTERKRARRPVRVLRTALIAAALCLALVGTVFAAEQIMERAGFVPGGWLSSVWSDEKGSHETIDWPDGSADPVEVRDGRLWFTADGQEVDITDLVDEDTPYIYIITLEDGGLDYVIAGGTPENYGYAEVVFGQDGTGYGTMGKDWFDIEPGGLPTYCAWYLAAEEQLGFS